jgi:hypothetical protein
MHTNATHNTLDTSHHTPHSVHRDLYLLRVVEILVLGEHQRAVDVLRVHAHSETHTRMHTRNHVDTSHKRAHTGTRLAFFGDGLLATGTDVACDVGDAVCVVGDSCGDGTCSVASPVARVDVLKVATSCARVSVCVMCIFTAYYA